MYLKPQLHLDFRSHDIKHELTTANRSKKKNKYGMLRQNKQKERKSKASRVKGKQQRCRVSNLLSPNVEVLAESWSDERRLRYT